MANSLHHPICPLQKVGANYNDVVPTHSKLRPGLFQLPVPLGLGSHLGLGPIWGQGPNYLGPGLILAESHLGLGPHLQPTPFPSKRIDLIHGLIEKHTK